MKPLFQTFSVLDDCYVFDANSNCILPLTESQYNELLEVEAGNLEHDRCAFIIDGQKQGFFKSVNIEEIKHPETDAMKYFLERRLSKLTLQVTQHCNLNCSYCVYSGDYSNREHSQKTMDFSVAKKAIDYTLNHSVDDHKINFSFYGGEPLLEIDFIMKCISYIKQVATGKNYSFNITTNGTLLTPDVYKVLTDSNVTISVSLDGPQAIHDETRKYSDGRGSFDDIMNNLREIEKIYPDAKENISFLTVISPDVDHSCLEQLFSMDDLFPYYGISLSFVSGLYANNEIIYEDELLQKYNQEKAKLFLSMLGKLEKSMVSPLIANTASVYIKAAGQLKKINGIPSSCHPGGPCLAGVQRLFVNADGVFYPCERVSETSLPMQIGDVEHGIDAEKAKTLINVGTTTADDCRKCWAILHCNMCAANADVLTSLSGEKRIQQCDDVKGRLISLFSEVCFLKKQGYDFDYFSRGVQQ